MKKLGQYEGVLVFVVSVGAALGAYALGAQDLATVFASFAVGAAAIKPVFRGRE